ncbi:DUF4810 domain-containing protein [Pasteurella sp. PK-2025]|uniref:DUF4810 domain-containing protein n=1 Tax=unclassified Pasteurella TaxID=2621516 RepID=UPI003C70B388
MLGRMKLVGLFSAICVLTACHSPQGLYYWGNYNDVIYHYYEKPGEFDKQEASLVKIIEKAKTLNKQVGPGIYGQLGLVQLKQGKAAEAQASFEQEQALYPESTAFIQFLQGKKPVVKSTKGR